MLTVDRRKGIAPDEIWEEMSDIYPHLFSKDIINQEDMLEAILAAVRAARESKRKLNKMNKHEEAHGMNMKKEMLKILFENAKGNFAKFIAVRIETEGNHAPEIIINPFENFDEKLRYYQEAYDEDMELIATKGKKRIRITAIAQGDSFADIEWQIIEEKPDYKKLLSEAIDRTVERMLEKTPSTNPVSESYVKLMLESIKQSFTEKRYSPSQEKFICSNITLYEEMFEVCMSGTPQEFNEKFTELSKRLAEAE